MTDVSIGTLESQKNGPASPRILIVGAGMSGLCLGARLKQTGLHDFTILESSDEVGGTWLHNTYPGAACDIPAHLYAFSFAPKYDWSRKYAPQREILDYLKAVANRYELYEHIKFNTKFKRAEFDAEARKWHIEDGNGRRYAANFLVSAIGQLNRPTIPDIPGLGQFQGDSWHTARWRHDVSLTAKRVAVIGVGASAIQLIPQIADEAKELQIYQRSPHWVYPLGDHRYSGPRQAAFRYVPFLHCVDH